MYPQQRKRDLLRRTKTNDPFTDVNSAMVFIITFVCVVFTKQAFNTLPVNDRTLSHAVTVCSY